MIFIGSKIGEVSPMIAPFSIHETISPLFLSIVAPEFPSTSKAQSLLEFETLWDSV